VVDAMLPRKASKLQIIRNCAPPARLSPYRAD
jgi:hypothetical protein